MSDFTWITQEVILAAHEFLLHRFGGSAGIRDSGALNSALRRPENMDNRNGANVFELAATYAGGIIKNRPFFNGNKRVGFMAAYIFLGANGRHFHATEEEVVERTLALAAGAITEADYALWLQRSCA